MAITQGFLSRPVTFAATTYALRVNVAGVSSTLTFPPTGALTVSRYYWMQSDLTADSSAGNGDLCKILKATLESHASSAGSGDFTVTLEDNGSGDIVLKVANNSSKAFAILWADGATTLNAQIFGHATTDETYTGGVYFQTSSFTPSSILCLGTPASTDSRNLPVVVGSRAVTVSGKVYAQSVNTGTFSRTIGWTFVKQRFVLNEYTTAPQTYSLAFDYFWRDYLSAGASIRYTGDLSAPGTYGRYRCMTDSRGIERSSSPVMFNLGPYEFRSTED
jgi:hypothetical protein